MNIFLSKVLILFFIVSIAGLSSIYSYQSVITYGLIPFMFLYALYFNSFKSFAMIDGYSLLYLGILVLSIVLSIILPVNFEAARINILRIGGIYLSIFLTIEFLNFNKYDFTTLFLLGFIIAFIIISIYAILKLSNMGSFMANIEETNRSGFELNANTYSYYSFFALISSLYLIEFYKDKKYIILSIILSLLGIYLSFITASRSGLLFVVIPSVAYWLFIFRSSILSPGIKFLLSGIFILLMAINIYKMYGNSYLKYRVDVSLESGDAREYLINESIEAIQNNFITGFGPGQLRYHIFNHSSFSHNSFTEITGDLGILGILLLLSIFLSPLIINIKMYFSGIYKEENNILKLNILFFGLFLLYNNLYTFYQTIFGMVFFMTIVNIMKKIKRGGFYYG